MDVKVYKKILFRYCNNDIVVDFIHSEIIPLSFFNIIEYIRSSTHLKYVGEKQNLFFKLFFICIKTSNLHSSLHPEVALNNKDNVIQFINKLGKISFLGFGML